MDFLKRYYDKLILGLLLLGLVVSMTILSASLKKARDSVQIDDKGILGKINSKPGLGELDTSQFAAAIPVEPLRLWTDDPNGEDSTLMSPGRYVGALDGSGYLLHFRDKRNPFTGGNDVSADDKATSETELEVIIATPVSDESEDVDKDGLPDRWEEAHGLSVQMLDQRTDVDRDGFSAIEEFAAKTDPTDASSQPPLASLVRFYRETAPLFPYELTKLSAVDPDDKSTWEIDVRMWSADGRYKDFLGLRLNSGLPPAKEFRIVDGEFRYKTVGGVPVDDHLVQVESTAGDRLTLPYRQRIATGDKVVQLYFILNSQSPQRLNLAPGAQLQLAGSAGVSETYSLSEGAPYTLTDAGGTQFPLRRLNVVEVRNRIQGPRPAPPPAIDPPVLPNSEDPSLRPPF